MKVEMIIKYFLVFGASLGIALFLTPIVRKVCLKWRLIDKGDLHRTHRKVITRLGGVAIYLAFIMAMGFAFLLENSREMVDFFSHFLVMFTGGTLIAGLGIYDDIKGASAQKKFFVQIIAAIILILFGFKVMRITNPFNGVIELGFLTVPITLLWIVGITNAINIIDGVDGLAAGIVSIVSLTLFLVSLPEGNITLAFVSLALAGASIGFLKYNFSPAKIFMGDTGSMFLGFMLAAISIEANRKSTVTVVLFISIISLGLPIVDTLVSIVRRLLKGSHIFRADTEHIHHHLLYLGLSHKQTALVLYSITIFLGLIAFICTLLRDKYAAILLVILLFVIVIAVRKLGIIRFALNKQADKLTGEIGQKKLAHIQLVPTLKKSLKVGMWVAIIIVFLVIFRFWYSSFGKYITCNYTGTLSKVK